MPKASDTAQAGETSVDPITAKARAVAIEGDWLSLVLVHHDQIRTAFTRAAQAPAGGSRLATMKGLAVLLNGHSTAEEVVLYPVLAQAKSKGATKPYDEQTQAKIAMAALELIDPSSDAWLDKLEEIRAAVLEHMLEEENRWFIDIKASGSNQAKLTAQYQEEFDRYTHAGSLGSNAAWGGPPRKQSA